MASGNGIMGQDPCWKYCTPMEGNKNGIVFNYCGLTIKSGGITRFKFHPSHIDPNSNTKKCPNVPLEVKKRNKTTSRTKKEGKSEENCRYKKDSI